jgi:pyochelin synthetase
VSAAELVSELAAAGVELWEEDGRIRFRAPQGALTEDLRERLGADRDAVLAYLRDPFAEPLVPDPYGRHLPFPLTEVQSSYLLGRTDAFSYGGIGCHAYLEYELPGTVAPERAAEAWRALVERHEALRTVYHPDGQQVLKDLPPYEIPVAVEVAGAEQAGRIRGELAQRTYDPAQWPLFDLRLTHSPERLLVHLSVDLLVTDFSGVQQLLGELEQLCVEPDRPLAPVPVSFRDHVLAERRLRDSARWARDRAYWLDRLDTLPPAPILPVLAGESGQEVRFRRLADRLTADESAGLRRRAAARDLTVSTVLLGAYAEVIGRWSAKPRFTLNLPVFAKRPVHPDIGRVVGDFTSVTLLAVEPDPREAFAERARALGGRLFEDLDHGLYSGIEVLREAARRSRPALMPVVFTSTLQGTEAPRTGEGRVVYGVTQTPQVWIDCQVMESGGEVLLGWDVRDGVLPEGLADEAFAAFAALVRELAVSDAPWDSSDPVRLPEAQAARHAEVNATERPLPEGLLHDRVFTAAATHADRTAVIAPDRTLTYAELAGYAHAVAVQLREAGVAPGARVAIVMDKGWEQVPAVLGALYAGCVYVPVDTVHPPARRARVLASSGATAVLTQARLDDSYAYELPSIAVDTLEPSDALEPRRVDPGEAAYIIYTSGSTGEPKGVEVSHRAALNTVADIDDRFGVGPDDRVLGLAQLGFDLSVYDLFGPLAHGGALVLPDAERRGDPSHWARLSARHRVTLWNSVPAQLQMLYDYLASGAGAADVAGLAELRLGLLSGDWIPVRLPDRVRALLPGLRLISLGGATEAAIWSIHHPIEQPVEPDRPSILYGRPLANQTFHVLDEALRARPDWVPGELCIGGSGLALGYHGDPETTARRFVPHPVTGERLYRTGDLGRWLPSGDVEFLGREDGQVKIRGHRIELAEIEAALADHQAVGAAAVLAVGDDPLQRRLVAFAESARLVNGQVPEVDDALVRRARETADAIEVGEPERIAEFARLLDEASLASMLDALRARGLFARPDAAHTADEVTAAAAVPRHHRVIRRWLSALHDEGLLDHDPVTGHYRLTGEPPSAASAWDQVAAVWSDELGPTELLAYLRAHADQLGELMDDRVAAVDLLFPAARMETADAAYRENIMSAYLNRVLAEALRTAAEAQAPGRPLRVLEVGAGTGASTAGALAALEGLPVDWLFTDVSPFFLDKARERFGPDPRLRFGLYDVDGDPVEQGLALNSFDVVVCAGVLNNARDAAASLTALRSLLAPGGLLLVTEPTREHYEILISQAFMMTEAEDLRRTDIRDSTFVTREQWLRLFAEAGGRNELCLPQRGHPLEPLGQHVFAVRFKTDRCAVDPADVGDHLTARLPVYMLPGALHVVDELPLTSNGKVDRKALAAWATAVGDEDRRTARTDQVAEPADELEQRCAEVVARALGAAAVPRERSLFDLGADSLILAQVAARLIEEVPEAADQQFDTLLRELLNRPTVADLARHLRGTEDAGDSATGTASALLTLGDEPDGRVLQVLVHEGIGTMAPYRELATQLSAHGPLVGLAVGDVEACADIPAERFVELLAAEHVRRLAATGADRFRLTGYCLGGQLATEVARQLTEGGAHVERLTVVSSSPPAFVCDDELLIEHAFARVLGADPAAAGYPDDEEELGAALRAVLDATPGLVPAGAFAALCGEARLEAVARRMRSLAELPQRERLAAIAGTLGGDGDAAHVPGLYRVFRHAFAAASLHTTQPYAGDITLVQPRGRLRFLAGFGQEADELWREVCLGDLTVVDVDGDHFSCLRAPHVRQVAAATTGGTP